MKTSSNSKPSRVSGMTMIELLITMSIAVVAISLLASGSFRGFIDDARMWSSSSTLVGCIQFARSEAVTQNIQVGTCASNEDRTDCSTDPADFVNGCLVYSNPAVDGGFDGDTGNLILVGDPMPDSQEVIASAHAIVFSPDGTVLSNQ